MEHNARVLSARMWSTIGAMMQVQQIILRGHSQRELALAVEAYQFECRRYETALQAFNSTSAMYIDAESYEVPALRE